MSFRNSKTNERRWYERRIVEIETIEHNSIKYILSILKHIFVLFSIFIQISAL